MKRLQSIKASTERHDGRRQERDRLRVGDQLPARLLADDLMRIFGIKAARFYQLVAAGRFDRFEIRPTIGRKAWSGKLLQAYLSQEGSSSRFVKAS